MKILILGGTIFSGRHIAESALTRRHEVTIFTRGRQLDGLSAEVERLRGDRHQDLSALENRQWDVVIDTSGYVPSAVEATAKQLVSAVGAYIYVSSLSVYGAITVPVDETTPVTEISDDEMTIAEALSGEESPTALTYGKYYGPLKARCEAVVKSYYPNNHLILRPGLVTGPFDYSNRFTYWLDRIKRGGEYLAPNNPQTPLRFIDARDLADWTIVGAESKRSGIENMPGPAGLTFGTLLKTIQQCLKADASPQWIAEPVLLDAGVKPWTELPLWLPENLQGIFNIPDAKALAGGLTYRDLTTTIDDTLQWLQNAKPDYKMFTGIDADKEQALLTQLA